MNKKQLLSLVSSVSLVLAMVGHALADSGWWQCNIQQNELACRERLVEEHPWWNVPTDEDGNVDYTDEEAWAEIVVALVEEGKISEDTKCGLINELCPTPEPTIEPTGTPTTEPTGTPTTEPTGTPTTGPTGTPTTEPTGTPTTEPTGTPTTEPTGTPTTEPTSTPTTEPTSTPTTEPTGTPTTEPTEAPRENACLRINFEQGPDSARRGTCVVQETGGRILATWDADNGWMDSGWIEEIDITFDSVYVQVFWVKGDGSSPVEMVIINPAPIDPELNPEGAYGWLSRGMCHSLEVRWPISN